MVDFRLTAFGKKHLRGQWRQFDDRCGRGGEKMKLFLKMVKWLLVVAALAVVSVAGWLYLAPPALIRVATGYSAKIVCSNVFVAGRQPDAVLKVDVQAPGHPILKFISIETDKDKRLVRASLLGLFGRSTAVARDGFGCALAPDGAVERAQFLPAAAPPAATKPDALWPEGNRVEASQDPEIQKVLNDPKMTGPDMRAIVVIHNGRIIGERYANGFSAETPLLGWSMTKTVTAAIIGTLIKDGRLSLDKKDLFQPWLADSRKGISLADLMGMSSGLEFNEDYGDVTDVTRMLYLEPDMAGFVETKPLTGEIGKTWSYSSGTTTLLSRIWQDSLGEPAKALTWPRTALFDPVGMTSAVLETDENGTFVGSSYLYATARDWARFGQLLLQDGVWNGEAILPSGFVAWMREQVPASNGEYGKGQLWLRGSDAGTPAGVDPDIGYTLPEDTFWMLGHDGQSIAIIPSKKLVIVRLGLTPYKLGYKAQGLVEAFTKLFE